MSKYLMDSSAVLTILFDELGSNEILKYLGNASISSVNYCEVISKVVQRKACPEISNLQIKSIIENIIPFDEKIALYAGTLINSTKEFGLSLGDRACIATAINHEFEIITTDKIWSKLNLPIKISVMR